MGRWLFVEFWAEEICKLDGGVDGGVRPFEEDYNL